MRKYGKQGDPGALHIPQRTDDSLLPNTHVGIEEQQVITRRLLRQTVAGMILSEPSGRQVTSGKQPYPGILPGVPAHGVGRCVGRTVVVDENLADAGAPGRQVAQQVTDMPLLVADGYEHRNFRQGDITRPAPSPKGFSGPVRDADAQTYQCESKHDPSE